MFFLCHPVKCFVEPVEPTVPIPSWLISPGSVATLRRCPRLQASSVPLHHVPNHGVISKHRHHLIVKNNARVERSIVVCASSFSFRGGAGDVLG